MWRTWERERERDTHTHTHTQFDKKVDSMLKYDKPIPVFYIT